MAATSTASSQSAPAPVQEQLRRFTLDEYHKLGEVGILGLRERVELLDGLLVQMSQIGPRHQFILEQLVEAFINQSQGRYRVSPGRPIPIPDHDEPQPDLALIKRGLPTARHVTPTEIFLVIEISDTTLATDLDKKRQLYQSVGIPEYWVIGIRSRIVRVYRLAADGTYSETVHSKGPLSPKAFPDVKIEADTVFLGGQ
jgi:Uma2 family endonuclease